VYLGMGRTGKRRHAHTIPCPRLVGRGFSLRLSVPLVSTYALGVVNLAALTNIERVTQGLTLLDFLCTLLCSLALDLYTITVARLDKNP
jgi:hypothetical protein